MNFDLIRQIVTGVSDKIYPGSFANQHIVKNLTGNSDYDCAIIGLPDNEKQNSFEAVKQVKLQLYKLTSVSKKLNILDLGNIIPGNNIEETENRITLISSEFIKNNIKLIYIGNSKIFNNSINRAFSDNSFPLNQVWVDSTISWEHFMVDPLSQNLNISNKISPLNFINLGYQTYFVENEILDFINEVNFEAYRLGIIRSNVFEFEPVLRDAHSINFSLNAVKYSDSPASENSSPNGLNGEDACQLAYYSGYSNNIKLFTISGFNFNSTLIDCSIKLSAQILWHVFEGMVSKIEEDPKDEAASFSTYHIHLSSANQNLVFYQSNLTQRWWMELEDNLLKHSVILSCSQKDYEIACNQEIPDRLWRLIKRLDGI